MVLSHNILQQERRRLELVEHRQEDHRRKEVERILVDKLEEVVASRKVADKQVEAAEDILLQDRLVDKFLEDIVPVDSLDMTLYL